MVIVNERDRTVQTKDRTTERPENLSQSRYNRREYPFEIIDSKQIRTDGSGRPSKDQPKLALGDTVTDREKGDETEMLVTGLPLEAANEFTAKGKTIAEHNPSYPADDR